MWMTLPEWTPGPTQCTSLEQLNLLRLVAKIDSLQAFKSDLICALAVYKSKSGGQQWVGSLWGKKEGSIGIQLWLWIIILLLQTFTKKAWPHCVMEVISFLFPLDLFRWFFLSLVFSELGGCSNCELGRIWFLILDFHKHSNAKINWREIPVYCEV